MLHFLSVQAVLAVAQYAVAYADELAAVQHNGLSALNSRLDCGH